MQQTIEVRWETERPGCGYQMLTLGLDYDGADGMQVARTWRPINREAIEKHLDDGGMVRWNPTGGK